MTKSFLWNTDFEYTSPFFGWINFDQEKQKFIFLDQDSISYYNVANNHLTTFGYQNKISIQNQLGMSFIDTAHNRLYTYEVNNQPRNSATIAYIDMDSMRWNAISNKHLSMQRHHHNGFVDSQKNRYIIFGGFGNKKYNNSFLSFDYIENRWDTLHFKGDTIAPRYFSGMVYNHQKNALYILGGMGNATGDQTLGRSYFYDLHQVDLSTQTITKLWEIPWVENNVVLARNMLMLDDSSIYALCYPEHITNSNLQLYKFSIADGSYQTYGDCIPIQSEKIETNANLYYSDVVKKIYCVVQELTLTQSKVSLYSLTYPPSTEGGLNKYSTKSTNNIYLLLSIPLLFIIVGLLCLILYIKKRKNPEHTVATLENGESNDFLLDEITPRIECNNAIYLFGEFTIFDKTGKNITYMFSNKLKFLFILLLQHYDNGVSSLEITQLMWPDSTPDKLKNLRGVTISNLRKILSELDGIELVYEDGYYRLIIATICFCDVKLLGNKDRASEKQLIEILSRGEFLKHIDSDLFDTFKLNVTEKIESILLPLLQKKNQLGDYANIIKLSNILFITDPLNETALYLQIQSLVKLRKFDLAKKKYDTYCSNYRLSMGEEYSNSYQSILKNEQ